MSQRKEKLLSAVATLSGWVKNLRHANFYYDIGETVVDWKFWYLFVLGNLSELVQIAFIQSLLFLSKRSPLLEQSALEQLLPPFSVTVPLAYAKLT